MQPVTAQPVTETSWPSADAPGPGGNGGLSVTAGEPLPFGATPVPGGVRFAVASNRATSMTLVLFRRGDAAAFAELPFPDEFRVGGVFTMTVMGLDPVGVEYGYRAEGPFDPALGNRFQPGRLLLDPYATAVAGREVWGLPHEPLEHEPYRGLVLDGQFDWGDDRPLRLPAQDLIIYEMHVRGFTRHATSGVRAPGTFAGLIEKIPYLSDLGINCVELLPVFEFDECDNSNTNPVTGQRLHNYWGYNTVSFFAPKASYAASCATGGQVVELKNLVKHLHAAGIEVILDVVFNHTAEGNERGPTISFRGLDDRAYYMLSPAGDYMNFSGTGNTFNCNSPAARELLLTCLRYWVTEYHIDGFRFDLASILARAPNGAPMANPPVLESIAADPVLLDTKLVAEAWDAGGLYQVGSFAHYSRWAEWNGRYRDAARRFLRGEPDASGRMATCMVGSPDLYGGRGTCASINFVTCHDGFTIHDLFAYNDKHNDANGEGNNDGDNGNNSWNCGQEGPTDDPTINHLRDRLRRNALLLLMTSHGVPMLTAGDEMGRTQQGNNNAYCQDNELSWVDWTGVVQHADLVRFTRNAIAFRRTHPALRPAQHVTGVGNHTILADVSWHGSCAWAPEWSSERPLFAVMFHGHGEIDGREDIVYLAANSYWEPHRFQLPTLPRGLIWSKFADTSLPAPNDICVPGQETVLSNQSLLLVDARSFVVLTATAFSIPAPSAFSSPTPTLK